MHPVKRRFISVTAFGVALALGGSLSANAAPVEGQRAAAHHSPQNIPIPTLPPEEQTLPWAHEVAADVESMNVEQLAELHELNDLIVAAANERGGLLVPPRDNPHVPSPASEGQSAPSSNNAPTAIPAVYAAYVATCAKLALASVPLTALNDFKNGVASPWHDYIFNAIASCAVPIIGGWLWRSVPQSWKQQFANLVVSIIIRWGPG